MTIKSYQNTKKEWEVIQDRLHAIQDTDHHLNLEKKSLEELSTKLEEYIVSMENNLKQLTGIEYELYYEIVVNGTNITKAIDKISFKHDKEVSTIWKYYYPKIKEKIDFLKIV